METVEGYDPKRFQLVRLCECGCGAHVARGRRFVCGHTHRKYTERPSVAVLDELYRVERQSAGDIARRFNAHWTTVLDWLRKAGIRVRARGESRAIRGTKANAAAIESGQRLARECPQEVRRENGRRVFKTLSRRDIVRNTKKAANRSGELRSARTERREVVCANCAKCFTKTLGQYNAALKSNKSGNLYCSQICANAGLRKYREIRRCVVCGDVICRLPSEFHNAPERTCCSKSCVGKLAHGIVRFAPLSRSGNAKLPDWIIEAREKLDRLAQEPAEEPVTDANGR